MSTKIKDELSRIDLKQSMEKLKAFRTNFVDNKQPEKTSLLNPYQRMTQNIELVISELAKIKIIYDESVDPVAKIKIMHNIRKHIANCQKEFVCLKYLTNNQLQSEEIDQTVVDFRIGHIVALNCKIQTFKQSLGLEVTIQSEMGGRTKRKGIMDWENENAQKNISQFEKQNIEMQTQIEETTIIENQKIIDSTLDEIATSVQRLKQQAYAIKDELNTQEIILTDVDRAIVEAHCKISKTNLRLKKLIKKINPMTCPLNVVMILIILAIVGYFAYQFKQ